MTEVSSPAPVSSHAPGPSSRRLGVRVRVRGDVDLSSAPRLALRLRHALSLPVERVRVDLTGVDFMDSQGLNVLNAVRVEAAERNVALVLESPPPSVQRLLEVTGMTQLFEVHVA